MIKTTAGKLYPGREYPDPFSDQDRDGHLSPWHPSDFP